jgi:hypothetical protein
MQYSKEQHSTMYDTEQYSTMTCMASSIFHNLLPHLQKESCIPYRMYIGVNNESMSVILHRFSPHGGREPCYIRYPCRANTTLNTTTTTTPGRKSPSTSWKWRDCAKRMTGRVWRGYALAMNNLPQIYNSNRNAADAAALIWGTFPD